MRTELERRSFCAKTEFCCPAVGVTLAAIGVRMRPSRLDLAPLSFFISTNSEMARTTCTGLFGAPMSNAPRSVKGARSLSFS